MDEFKWTDYKNKSVLSQGDDLENYEAVLDHKKKTLWIRDYNIEVNLCVETDKLEELKEKADESYNNFLNSMG